ncbi:hypothetical protein GBAR_LOCUS16327 [Geodia barretti]|uniref:Death domain-containing protein n=1 Tax=Geodia barretti TaxID=519541 RepID=A0AA35WW23_GEOBA|nr:hypothetical protein GBAR_LOCUS16327 [Geodia barretti]
MNNTDIPPDILDTIVDDYYIKVIANKYLISWEELVPVLGFTYAQERAISRSFPNDYGQQKRSFLYQWKDLNGDGATYRVLINAAEAEEHRNLADNIRKLLRERFRISSPPSLAVRPALSAPLVCCCFESIAYLHHELFPVASSSHPYPPLDPLYIAGKCGSQPYPIISHKLKKRRSYHIPPQPPSVALNHNCLCTTQTLSWPTNILQKLSHLEDTFVMVLTNAQYCFSNMTPEYTDRFKILLINLPISTRFEHLTFLTVESQGISSARNMMEIFQILKNHWNPFDIGLLEHLVDVFGTGDLKQDMDNYKKNLEAFEKSTTVQRFQDAWNKSIHAPDHYGRIVKIMKADPFRCTLWKVRCFKENLRKRATLQNYVGAVTRLAVSSVIITFALPRYGILLVKNNIDAGFWADQNMESVTIDGEEVFPVCSM